MSGTLMQTVVDTPELAAQFAQVISKATYICQYRSSPNHKAVIVEFVKKSKYLGYPITCAVGDGANDVTMI
jgi:P-type E1-E2 ATPase